MRGLIILATLLAVASTPIPAAAWQRANPAAADAWEIGPIIRGRNHSVGMPLTPTPGRRGWHFDFPYPSVGAGHVHYLTFNHGPLTGKRRIVMRYRIEAGRGVRFVSRETPHLPATISLFFQQRGDRWTGRGRYETYRWYAPSPTVMPLRAGEYVMTASLDDHWISVQGVSVAARPAGFQQAIANAERVGFVLGTGSARGHGVFATGPARLTVISFQVL